MWPDLTKAGFHTHNGKADFSLPFDFYINELTIHVCIIAIVSLVCFSWGMILGPVWCAWVIFKWQWCKWTSTHPAENRHTTGKKAWPLNWLLFVIFRAQMGLRWDLLAVSTSTRGKTHHSRGSPPPPASTPIIMIFCDSGVSKIGGDSRYIVFYISKLYFYVFINMCGSWLFSNPVTHQLLEFWK